MLKRITIALLLGWILIAAGCKEPAKNKTIVYVPIGDSSFPHDNIYKEKFTKWKGVYEKCMNYQLFSNAAYLGLQRQINVGSINNKAAFNINGDITVIDTTFSSKFFDLVAFIGSSNCYTKINLTKSLQSEFTAELARALVQSNQYSYLNDLIDTAHIAFRITTLAENSIRPDSLASILQRTKDTSLLRFKELLVTPGNAILIRDAVIYGFYAEFALKKQLSSADREKFKKEVFFSLGNQGSTRIMKETGSIKLVGNDHLMIVINRYYTVFGEFYIFKETEQ
jgi:hypothetical protein